jgi:DNA-binding transcriptional regulator GbsR (MarR family)
MIADEPMVGLDQMAEQLNISKASASTCARQLQAFTLIEKVTIPGDRKDYYRVVSNAVEYLKTSMAGSIRLAKHLYTAMNVALQDFFNEYQYVQPKPLRKPARKPVRIPARKPKKGKS